MLGMRCAWGDTSHSNKALHVRIIMEQKTKICFIEYTPSLWDVRLNNTLILHHLTNKDKNELLQDLLSHDDETVSISMLAYK